MPRRSRELDLSNPVHVFTARLREIYLGAGAPNQTELARKMHVARPSVSAFLNARRFPTWTDAEALIKACGSPDREVERLRAEWIRTRKALEGNPNLLNPTAARPDGAQAAMSGISPEDIGTLESFSHATSALPFDEPKQENVTITWFDDNEEFYSTAAERLLVAKRKLLATYIRRHPPSYYTSDAAAKYFQAVLDWAREPGARSVRRILCVPNAEMYEWAIQHEAETREIRNYEVRVVPWQLDADSFNLALMDDSISFIAFSGTAFQDLSGLEAFSEKLNRRFTDYFEQFWAGGTDLRSYLASNKMA